MYSVDDYCRSEKTPYPSPLYSTQIMYKQIEFGDWKIHGIPIHQLKDTDEKAQEMKDNLELGNHSER